MSDAAGRRARRDTILRMLGEHQEVLVTELSRQFAVSEMTVRRDLGELQREGVLRRTHGGAVRPDRSPFETRTVRLQPEKIRIAERAAALVADGDAVGIDTGTTAYYVARELSRRSDLLVVTNSIHVAVEFRNTPNRVLLVGGTMLPELSMVGPLATAAVRRLHLDTLILGCGGLTLDRGLAYFHLDEVEVRRALLDIADRTVVVADRTKFGRTETISLTGVDAVDVVVTDAEPARPYRDLLARHGVELVVVGARDDEGVPGDAVPANAAPSPAAPSRLAR
jgi:DeoR/GlpR family transcriptional regulator of sugar metabolism